MKRKLQKIVQKLKSEKLAKKDFFRFLDSLEGLFGDADLAYEYLKANGLPVVEEGEFVYLETAVTPYQDEVFCVVDIETNGSKPINAQIIEIGAIKIQNGQIIDHMESFVHTTDVPDYITKVTGIEAADLRHAPNQREVLLRFREFLNENVFVAHNVEFDYGFISAMMSKHNLGFLANRKLCTIDLARKTIESERYGLEYLNVFLNINTEVSHRAYADALTAAKLLDLCMEKLPPEIKTTEDLIDFSKPSRMKKKKTEKTPAANSDERPPSQ